MRLVFVLDQWPELSETFVVNELQALRRRGDDVRVQAAGRAAHPNPDAPADIDIHVLGEDSPRRTAGDLLWLLRRRPLACARDVVRSRRWGRAEWARPLRALAPAARAIVERGDEHLHAHFASGAALDAMRLAALTGRTFSVTAHAYDIFLTPRNLREKLERADAVFTGCEYNMRHLRAIAPAANLHKVVMGVRAKTFRRAGPLPCGNSVLAVGRLVEKKGFGVLIDALAQLPDVRARIVGDGPLRAALEEHVARAGVADRVEFAGSAAPADVRRALEGADVLAMPCVVARDGDRDSMPVVVKEAMAMQLLVVASDEVGLPECVLAPWGTLAAPGDAQALAAGLRDALALAPEERLRAGRAAREWVREHADVDRETARMATVLQTMRR
ncbi:MAG TPA: glycosyltransferase [Solirubrobacteraceae bacterium]|nr:glycosyltransferase [Solirubrobacteraceae bacterium]